MHGAGGTSGDLKQEETELGASKGCVLTGDLQGQLGQVRKVSRRGQVRQQAPWGCAWLKVSERHEEAATEVGRVQLMGERGRGAREGLGPGGTLKIP